MLTRDRLCSEGGASLRRMGGRPEQAPAAPRRKGQLDSPRIAMKDQCGRWTLASASRRDASLRALSRQENWILEVRKKLTVLLSRARSTRNVLLLTFSAPSFRSDGAAVDPLRSTPRGSEECSQQQAGRRLHTNTVRQLSELIASK